MSSLALYHGGTRRLDRKGLILPPSQTGAPSNADYGAKTVCRRDRVYLTTEIDQAQIFACLAPWRPGDIYEVEPIGDLEIDPDYHGSGESFQVPMARILRVVERNVKKVAGRSRSELAVDLNPSGEFFSSGRRAQVFA